MTRAISIPFGTSMYIEGRRHKAEGVHAKGFLFQTQERIANDLMRTHSMAKETGHPRYNSRTVTGEKVLDR